ncbi:MAG: O-antigen ligase family protein [Bacteroidales bacterium]|nr:O-antigen ligase family protein [Bacteroidales bacterium]
MELLTGHTTRTPRWLWIAALAFVVINAIFIAFEVYYVPLVPVVLLFALFAFTRIDILLYSIVVFTPLSLLLSFFAEDLGVDLYLPTEPLLGLLLLVYLLRYAGGVRTDLRLLRHPVTLAIYFNLAWLFITIFSSSDPLVSVKFFVSRLWFITGFYFVALEVFRRQRNMKRYIWLYVASFSVVIIYTLIRHSAYGFDNQMMAHSMMKPFYKDHTSYGATLAFLLPLLVTFFVLTRKGDMNSKFLIGLLILFFGVATVFSYTRAAWVSLIGAFMVWGTIKLRIRVEIIAIAAAGLIVLFFVFQPMILMKLESNRTKSSGDLAEHVQSIANISNDQSNLERINRWSCAIRMWKERPLLGFGPGTYQFEYGRFQRSYERTEISTNFGVRGTAHSEYLGPLSESGVFGLLSFLLVIITTIITGIRVYLNARSKAVRTLSLGVLTGLVTYYIHGVLNNFLDTDKASALFWGLTAMLVVMDVFHRQEPEREAV